MAFKLEPDPVIDAYKPGIDQTLFRENLKLTVEQRIVNLMKLQEAADELRQAARRKPDREFEANAELELILEQRKK